MSYPSRSARVLLSVALTLAVGAGVLGRGYWTPDEPREADIAWRMSWQSAKAVPLLAGEAFCEKPPLTYWAAGAVMGVVGADAWAARLPNLLYALITALAVGLLARRSVGRSAGWAAAAAITTLLLSYQVAIWLATDAPLLATVALALLGLHIGFYAEGRAARLRGYTGMHAALALAFLSKSAAAWMVPALTFVTLTVWERRWREWLRWELYVGLLLQAAAILTWVGFVYVGPDGPAHLKVFFWNNLVGRFAQVDAPEALQYAGAHRNAPGKYLLELPIYLWPWTLLVIAAARSAWRQRRVALETWRPVRFALAAFLPSLAVLSVAATARNIYLAPALPGLALLVGWWVNTLGSAADRWDKRAIGATVGLLLLASAVLTLAVIIIGRDGWESLSSRTMFVSLSAAGLALSTGLSLWAARALHQGRLPASLFGLLLAYCVLLSGPAPQIYRRLDAWQDLPAIGRTLARDSTGQPLVLFAPDETTRAFVDMYTRSSVTLIVGPSAASSWRELAKQLAAQPTSLVLTQLPSPRSSELLRTLIGGLEHAPRTIAAASQPTDLPAWAATARLRILHRYALPNGRRYALLGLDTRAAH